LGCIDLNDLSKEEQEQHAFFLGLAALLGEAVYNLGELVSSFCFKVCFTVNFLMS